MYDLLTCAASKPNMTVSGGPAVSTPLPPQQTVRGPAPDEPMFDDWQLDYCLRVAVAQGQLDTCRCLVAAGASGSQVRLGEAGRA